MPCPNRCHCSIVRDGKDHTFRICSQFFFSNFFLTPFSRSSTTTFSPLCCSRQIHHLEPHQMLLHMLLTWSWSFLPLFAPGTPMDWSPCWSCSSQTTPLFRSSTLTFSHLHCSREFHWLELQSDRCSFMCHVTLSQSFLPLFAPGTAMGWNLCWSCSSQTTPWCRS